MSEVKEFKVSLLGNKNSGKTTLSMKLVTNKSKDNDFEDLSWN
jgi:GTPase SAR1 family protein